jgi:hypothetical protein
MTLNFQFESIEMLSVSGYVATRCHTAVLFRNLQIVKSVLFRVICQLLIVLLCVYWIMLVKIS